LLNENSLSVRFVLPPASQHIAGIKNAVDGLAYSLRMNGVSVAEGGDLSDVGAIHHFHGLWHPTHALLAARLRRASMPYLVSPHGMLEPWALKHQSWKKRPYFKLIESLYLLGADALHVTSNMEAENVANVVNHASIDKVAIGCRDPRGADYGRARNALNWPDDELVLLYLSRIDIKKGLDLLLKALSGINAQKKVRLVVVGDGSPKYVAEMKQLGERAVGNTLQIEWVGSVWGDSRWQYIQAADLFCLPTHSENFGIAVLEALHAGTPVLTTDQTPWVESRDKNGFFISSPNLSSVKNSLLDAFERLECGWSQNDREILAKWAEENFSWNNLVHEYINIYQRINQHHASRSFRGH